MQRLTLGDYRDSVLIGQVFPGWFCWGFVVHVLLCMSSPMIFLDWPPGQGAPQC